MTTLHLTLKMPTAQVVETSVTHNSLSKDYPHLDDHTKQNHAYLIQVCLALLHKVQDWDLVLRVQLPVGWHLGQQQQQVLLLLYHLALVLRLPLVSYWVGPNQQQHRRTSHLGVQQQLPLSLDCWVAWQAQQHQLHFHLVGLLQQVLQG